MLNWIKFFGVFLSILTVIIVFTVLYQANKPFSSTKQDAINAVIQSGQLVSTSSATIFNSKEPYVTVFGLDKDGVEKAVFVTGDGKAGYQEVKMTEGISAEKAVETVKKDVNVKKVLHVTLGVEEEGPVWEIAFKSDNGKLNYVYVLFENGQWWKRILNL